MTCRQLSTSTSSTPARRYHVARVAGAAVLAGMMAVSLFPVTTSAAPSDRAKDNSVFEGPDGKKYKVVGPKKAETPYYFMQSTLGVNVLVNNESAKARVGTQRIAELDRDGEFYGVWPQMYDQWVTTFFGDIKYINPDHRSLLTKHLKRSDLNLNGVKLGTDRGAEILAKRYGELSSAKKKGVYRSLTGFDKELRETKVAALEKEIDYYRQQPPQSEAYRNNVVKKGQQVGFWKSHGDTVQGTVPSNPDKPVKSDALDVAQPSKYLVAPRYYDDLERPKKNTVQGG